MQTSPMDEEWDLITTLLPSRWRELAREKKAIRRAKGIADPEILLRLILLHVATGLSLKQAVARARVQGIAAISDVALLKRLRASEAWLRELTRGMFEASRFGGEVPSVPEGHRLRAVDATTVEEPGATGTDWRVHYSISLPSMACDFYEVTDVKGGETYKRIPVKAGDIILGDRGYCHREGVAHVLRHRGDVIVRLNLSSFPLLDRDGKSFDLLTHLRQLPQSKSGEWLVRFDAKGGSFNGRLCAIRKSQAAAEKAKVKLRREARKDKRTVQPDTLESAEYIFVFTSLPGEKVAASEILNLYRARWQIELCFKRMKSLLHMGHVPKRSDESARAWIQAKLLTVLLIERLLLDARFFSPWGYSLSS